MSDANPAPISSPNIPNTVCCMHGSTHEPLHPSTRTFKRRMIDRNVSELLATLDYTGSRLSEARKECRVLQSVLAIKNEEIELLTKELHSLKKERQEIWADYQDLNIRYQERVEDLRRNRK
jgi:cell division protein FtsB